MNQQNPQFTGGKNIAMKVPSHEFEATVTFYKSILKLPVIKETTSNLLLRFGEIQLWIDKVDHLSQAEIWLEVETDDVDAAKQLLADHGIQRRDKIEVLPKNFTGLWIANPANIIHLVTLSSQ